MKTKNIQAEMIQAEIFNNLHILALNIDHEYLLELLCRDGCNKNPHSMFWIKKIRKIVYSCTLQFSVEKHIIILVIKSIML